MKFDCEGCKNSCCVSKKPALNKGDVVRIFKKVGKDILKYVIFRSDIKGRSVNGNNHEGVLTIRDKEDGSCIFYENGLCSIYDVRPLSCRLFPYNPIFKEGKNGYTKNVTVSPCKEIEKGRSFKISPTDLQWRKERLEYDKIVFQWNSQKNRDLINFLKVLVS